MPFCPECEYEYEDGIEECPDCGAGLVGQLPRDDDEEELVPVYYASGEIEADIVKGLLESAGIPVLEKADVQEWPGPFTVGPLSEEAVVVPVSRADEARKLIADAIETGKKMPVDEA